MYYRPSVLRRCFQVPDVMRRAREAGAIKVLPRRGRAWSLGVVVLYGLKGRSCECTMPGFDMMICVTHVAAGKIRIRTTFQGDLMRHRWIQGEGGQQGDDMGSLTASAGQFADRRGELAVRPSDHLASRPLTDTSRHIRGGYIWFKSK